MDASGRLRWLRAVLFVGVVYLVAGRLSPPTLPHPRARSMAGRDGGAGVRGRTRRSYRPCLNAALRRVTVSGDSLRDALRYWEPRRLWYNVALSLEAAAWVVFTWP